jgi:hypothetical protein
LFIQNLQDNNNDIHDAIATMKGIMNSTGLSDDVQPRASLPKYQYTTISNIMAKNASLHQELTKDYKFLEYLYENAQAFVDAVNTESNIYIALANMRIQFDDQKSSGQSSGSSSLSSSSSDSSSSSSSSSGSLGSKWVPSPYYRAVNELLFERYPNKNFTHDEINYIIQQCPEVCGNDI